MQGRPKGGPEDKYRLTPVVARLSQLLGKEVSSLCSDRIAPACRTAPQLRQLLPAWMLLSEADEADRQIGMQHMTR